MGDILTLVAAGVSCVAAVFSAWFARRHSVVELRDQVDSVLDLADRLAREIRSSKMQRVRAAAREAAPPELSTAIQNEPPTLSAITDKASLRRKVFGNIVRN